MIKKYHKLRLFRNYKLGKNLIKSETSGNQGHWQMSETEK